MVVLTPLLKGQQTHEGTFTEFADGDPALEIAIQRPPTSSCIGHHLPCHTERMVLMRFVCNFDVRCHEFPPAKSHFSTAHTESGAPRSDWFIIIVFDQTLFELPQDL